jgi:hypothetical protein
MIEATKRKVEARKQEILSKAAASAPPTSAGPADISQLKANVAAKYGNHTVAVRIDTLTLTPAAEPGCSFFSRR